MMAAYQALGVSPGVAVAPVVVLDHREVVDPGRRGEPSDQGPRLRDALAATQADLVRLRDRTLARLGEASADIFNAHLSMVADPELWALIDAQVAEGWDAETAVYRACQTFIDLLSQLEEEGQRSRADDLKDLRRRLQGHLSGVAASAQASGPCILVADDLTPSETAGLDLECVLGFVTAAGSRTSHASILARSLGLPAATGAGAVVAAARSGQLLALNGTTGEVVLDPDTTERERFETFGRREAAERAWKATYAGRATTTLDGAHIDLAANIGKVEDLKAVVANGAEGVGLLRTEFLFLERDRMPTEDEQTTVYRHTLEALNGRPVVIRTLDIGGDKNLPYLPQAPELNPFLGVRALRLCLAQPELFRTQIRALLRASPAGDLRVMVPMVALVEEVRAVKALFAQEAVALAAEGVATAPFQLGIMVEIPAAALNAGALAAEADFFSLGTNDLIQYTMAADRMNEHLSSLYQPLHPSILRLVDFTVRGAHAHGRWVGVCGEMAGEPEAALVLLGLGVDELSLSAPGIPGLRALFSRVDQARATETARLALEKGTSAEVLDLVRARHPELTHQGDRP